MKELAEDADEVAIGGANLTGASGLETVKSVLPA
jgi:hypothetical protein